MVHDLPKLSPVQNALLTAFQRYLDQYTRDGAVAFLGRGLSGYPVLYGAGYVIELLDSERVRLCDGSVFTLGTPDQMGQLHAIVYAACEMARVDDSYIYETYAEVRRLDREHRTEGRSLLGNNSRSGNYFLCHSQDNTLTFYLNERLNYVSFKPPSGDLMLFTPWDAEGLLQTLDEFDFFRTQEGN